jgi:hypothetical protein
MHSLRLYVRSLPRQIFLRCRYVYRIDVINSHHIGGCLGIPDIQIRLSILAIVVGPDDSERVDLVECPSSIVAGELQLVSNPEHEDLGITGKLRVN